MMESRYQGRFNETMIGDFCWILMRKDHAISNKHNAKSRAFLKKTTIYPKTCNMTVSLFS